MKEDIKELLAFDGLAEAEKITGKDSANDDATVMLGMLSTMDNQERKQKALRATSDTRYDIKIEELFDILEVEGFEKIFQREFTRPDIYRADNETYDYIDSSNLYAFWHPTEFILVEFESYPRHKIEDGAVVAEYFTINSGSMYYCIKPNGDQREFGQLTSSGGFRNGIWSGNHDIREGFRFNLNNLRENGTFVKWT